MKSKAELKITMEYISKTSSWNPQAKVLIYIGILKQLKSFEKIKVNHLCRGLRSRRRRLARAR